MMIVSAHVQASTGAGPLADAPNKKRNKEQGLLRMTLSA
jgi:hypothetical protein